jgi:hypothetical protein
MNAALCAFAPLRENLLFYPRAAECDRFEARARVRVTKAGKGRLFAAAELITWRVC